MADQDIDLVVSDGKGDSPESILYESAASTKPPATATSASTIGQSLGLDSGERYWTLRFEGPGGLLSAAETNRVWLVFFGGTLLSFFFVGLSHSLYHTRQNANRMAERMTDFLFASIEEKRRSDMRRTLQAGEPMSYEEESNGRLKTYSLYPIIGEDEGADRLAIYCRDITERKNAELALKESEDRYRSLYESALDAILLTAPNGSIIAANKAACQMFGQSEAEIVAAMSSLAGPVVLETRMDQLAIEPKTAAPIGLIVTELVTNSLKYAFPEKRSGRKIVVMLKVEGREGILECADNGVGLPPGLDIARDAGTGLVLVRGLARQIGGSFEMKSAVTGSRGLLRFPWVASIEARTRQLSASEAGKGGRHRASPPINFPSSARICGSQRLGAEPSLAQAARIDAAIGASGSRKR